jgi:phage baseplate assembly protein W
MFTAIPTNSDVKDDYENDMKNLQHIKSSIKNLLETEIINARLKFFEI